MNVTMYEVYFENKEGAVLMGAETYRELERNITRISGEHRLIFRENFKADAVMIHLTDGELIGFYRQA